MSATGISMPHIDAHFDSLGLCQCPCDECTLRLTKMCVCADCACDSDSDHAGTGKEQVSREVLERMGWLPPR